MTINIEEKLEKIFNWSINDIKSDLISLIEEIRDEAYDDGNSNGYEEGKAEGLKLGYEEGHSDGVYEIEDRLKREKENQ
jgi:flagellar biosynthesis/type III secretory pathway protein FliH